MKVKPVKNLNGLSPIEDWIQHSQYVEQQRDTAQAEVERLTAELNSRGSQWVAVSERLPDSAFGDFIVCLENRAIFIATYSEFSRRWFVTGVGQVESGNPVIAWMPLPEPYTPPADRRVSDDQ